MTAPASEATRSDERLAEALDRFLAAQGTESPLGKEELLREYADVANELQACLASLEFIGAASRTVMPPAANEADIDDPDGAPRRTTSVFSGTSAAHTEQVLGDFRIVRDIGRGGMGVVYEAEQISLNRRVALKVLPFAGALDRRQLARFQTEAQAAAQLHHTHIVPVYAVGCDRGVHFYAMQFVDGQSLAEFIQQRRAAPPFAGHPAVQSGRGSSENGAAVDEGVNSTIALRALSTDRSRPTGESFRAVARLGVDVAEALECAHGLGIVHRDIKPSNLLLDAWGKIWVTDFGLARVLSDPGLTMTGDIVGTLRYMSPEQVQGQRTAIDQRTDIYSLGVTLYELLALEPAFPGDHRADLVRRIAFDEPRRLRTLNPNIPVELETIVLKAIHKNPAARYASAQELADDLRRFLEDQPIRAKRPTWGDFWTKWARRHRELVATAAVALVVLLIAVAVGSSLSAMWLRTERNTAREATRRAENDLWDARLAQARALRWSGRAGQRVESLQALTDAARLRPSLELRNEAIAALSLADMPLARSWRSAPYANVRAVDFNSDFTRYARYEGDGVVTIRDLPGDNEWQRLPPGPGTPYLVRFSPDDRFLAVSYYRLGVTGYEFRLWNLAEQKVVFEQTDKATERAYDFSSDGRRLAVGRTNGDIALVDLDSGETRLTLANKSAPHGIRFHPAGQALAVVSVGSNDVSIWDLEQSKVAHAFSHAARPQDVDYSSDGTRLAVALSDTRVVVWDAVTKERHALLEGHTRTVEGVVFQPGGRLLASHSWGGRTLVWDVESGSRCLELAGVAVRFRGDGRELAVQNGSQLERRDVVESDVLRRFFVQARGGEPATDVTFLRDERIVVSGGDDGVRLWDSHTKRQLARIDCGYTYSVAFDSRNSLLVVASVKGVSLWPLTRIEQAGEVVEQLGPARSIAFPNKTESRYAALSQDAGSLYVILRSMTHDALVDVKTGGVRLLDKPFYGRTPAISPDGRWAALGGTTERPVLLWNLSEGRVDRELADVVRGTAEFSPDGRWLATTTTETHRLWSVETWSLRRTIPSLENDKTNDLAFSPDGRLLAVCQSRHRVQLRDVRNGEELATLELTPNPARLESLSFSPDGSRLAATFVDAGVCVWNLRPLREHLAKMDLDWPAPPFPATSSPTADAVKPLRVELLTAP